MERENYKAEQLWLHAYFDNIQVLDLDLDAEIQMTNSGVTLPEVLDVLKSGTVTWAERDYDGCCFEITGRNCDDDKITILGMFRSEIEMVTVVNIYKAR